jgi:hypothetical protein
MAQEREKPPVNIAQQLKPKMLKAALRAFSNPSDKIFALNELGYAMWRKPDSMHEK